MNWPFWSLSRSSRSESCESIEPLLSLYVDGMASPAERQRLEAHLPGCEDCREALSWMQATQLALAARPVVTPPANLQSRIALAIAASSAAPVSLRPVRSFTSRPAYAAAVSLVIAGLFINYVMPHSPSETLVTHTPKPTHIASVPPAVVNVPRKNQPPHFVKVRPTQPFVASDTTPLETIKPNLVKPLPVPKKAEHGTVPVSQDRVASNAPAHATPTQHLAPLLVNVRVHSLPEHTQVANNRVLPLETHPSALPEKTALPKKSELPLIAKLPAPVPVHILPPIDIAQPEVRTASSTRSNPSRLADSMDLVKEDLRKMQSVAYEAPRQSLRGVTQAVNTLDTDHGAYYPAIYSTTANK